MNLDAIAAQSDSARDAWTRLNKRELAIQGDRVCSFPVSRGISLGAKYLFLSFGGGGGGTFILTDVDTHLKNF
jgi:hypothetical protein